jgi:hypothetical protein
MWAANAEGLPCKPWQEALAVDARVERNLSDQAFLRQRRVGDGYRHVSKMKPRQHGKGHENHAQDNSK